MKTILTVTVSAFALAALPTPVAAQHQNMPGMTMPMPAKPAAKGPAKKKAAARKPAKKKAAANKAVGRSGTGKAQAGGDARRARARETGDGRHDHANGAWRHSTIASACADADGSFAARRDANAGRARRQGCRWTIRRWTMGKWPMPMQHGEHAGHQMAMTGALGSYPMERESSGTAWQPDTSEHMGLHVMSGDWTLMAHGVLNLVYDHQSGPRGDDKAFASGMLMGMARRPLGNGTLQFKAMLSPDPLMGKSGYPLLLASGETANGADRLIDRQHPHDFFMELSASVSQNIGPKSSVFLYAGLPGEPAFGPPAFMHREAIMDSPEAPISHHWLDSTHISFGVVTGGHRARPGEARGQPLQRPRARPASLEHRDRAARFDRGPRCRGIRRATLALQGSWGHFERSRAARAGRRPEALVGERALRATRSRRAGSSPARSPGAARAVEGHNDDAYVAEASLKHAGWTVVRARRDDREPRAAPMSRARPGLSRRQGLARRRPRLPDRRAFLARRSAACSRSISCPTRWRRSTAGTIRPERWGSSG